MIKRSMFLILGVMLFGGLFGQSKNELLEEKVILGDKILKIDMEMEDVKFVLDQMIEGYNDMSAERRGMVKRIGEIDSLISVIDGDPVVKSEGDLLRYRVKNCDDYEIGESGIPLAKYISAVVDYSKYGVVRSDCRAYEWEANEGVRDTSSIYVYSGGGFKGNELRLDKSDDEGISGGDVVLEFERARYEAREGYRPLAYVTYDVEMDRIVQVLFIAANERNVDPEFEAGIYKDRIWYGYELGDYKGENDRRSLERYQNRRKYDVGGYEMNEEKN